MNKNPGVTNAALLAAEGLTPDKEQMPFDEGIKSQFPDQKIR
jgi:hypothetical protein